MIPTEMTMALVNGTLYANPSSLDKYDDGLLADIGIDRNWWPVDGRPQEPRQRRNSSHLLGWLVAPFRGLATSSINARTAA